MTDALKKMNDNGIVISEQEVIHISMKYHVRRLEVFGSVLRSDFTSESDIDLLITFDENADLSLFDLMDLEMELSEIFKRPVDVVEPASLVNPIRRKNILTTSELIYAA